MAAVDVKNVSKRFGAVTALDDVSLSIEKGEIFGLLGPNGAGKTTLISIMNTLTLPDAGSVTIFGRDVVADRIGVLEQIGVVSGDAEFFHRETPFEILRFHAKVRDVPDWRGRVEELIGLLEMEEFGDRNYGELSTGQKTKTALAKALVAKPRFIMLDEPTLGLDPDVSVKIRALISRLPKEGTTVLLTSHYMQEVEELCDRVAFIGKGKIVDIGTVRSLKKKLKERIRLSIRVEKIVDRAVLKKLGLRARGKNLEGSVDTDFGAFDMLAKLQEAGFSVERFDKHSPSLEDYFVKMAKEGKR